MKNTYRALILAIYAATIPCVLGSAAKCFRSGRRRREIASQGVGAKRTRRALLLRIASPSIALLPDAAAPLTSAAPIRPAKQLHILVGRSLFINTASRLRRVYVSNPAVINSFTSSPSQIVVTAKSPGMSSLILWDEAGQSQTYTVSSDIEVESLQRSIQQAFPKDDIKVEAQQDRVSLSGTVSSDASSDAAGKLAGLYTKDVVNALLVKPSCISGR